MRTMITIIIMIHDDLEPVQEVEGEEEEDGGEEEPVGEHAENAGSQATARESPGRLVSSNKYHHDTIITGRGYL